MTKKSVIPVTQGGKPASTQLKKNIMVVTKSR